MHMIALNVAAKAALARPKICAASAWVMRQTYPDFSVCRILACARY
jgi:hypothetical protein